MATSIEDDLPYNETNVALQHDELSDILNQFDIDEYYDINYYRRAFIHKSYVTRKNENYLDGNTKCPTNCLPLQENSNERLEFLGDSILSLTIARYVFERYPENNEGFLTTMRTKLVNGKMLACLADKIGLGKHLVISKQIEKNRGRSTKNILEDAFEAFIGAIFLDHEDKNGRGFQAAEKWIIAVVESLVDFSDLIHNVQNHKDVLIKYCMHTFNWRPTFHEVSVSEVDTGKLHTVVCKNDKGDIIGIGKSSSRKNAEIDSSEKGLSFYGYFGKANC